MRTRMESNYRARQAVTNVQFKAASLIFLLVTLSLFVLVLAYVSYNSQLSSATYHAMICSWKTAIISDEKYRFQMVSWNLSPSPQVLHRTNDRDTMIAGVYFYIITLTSVGIGDISMTEANILVLVRILIVFCVGKKQNFRNFRSSYSKKRGLS